MVSKKEDQGSDLQSIISGPKNFGEAAMKMEIPPRSLTVRP